MAATKRRKVSDQNDDRDEHLDYTDTTTTTNPNPNPNRHLHDADPDPNPNTTTTTTTTTTNSNDDPTEEEEDDEEEEEDHHQPNHNSNNNHKNNIEGGEGGEEDEEDISKLLEPLTREQLVSLLRSAAAADPNTLAEIRRFADADPSHRKIFVHGLNWSTSADALRSFFSQYGDIDECRVVTDRASGKSKGYGFVLFRRRSSARAALASPQKLIDGRMTACQLASIGPTSSAPPPLPPPSQHHQYHHYPSSSDTLSRKIYVGNVHSDIDGARLFDFFSHYGEIEEGPLGFDRHTGRPKGFALFIYRTQEGARKALEEPNKNFEGHLLYCQKATDGQRAKAAAAAAAAAANAPATPTSQGGGGAYAMQGPPGYSVPTAAGGGGGGGYNGGAMEMGMTQGIMGGPLAFGQGMPANAAALAMLAAAGQNPAAYGVPPALFASLNPALAAAMTGAAASPMAMQAAAVPAGQAGYGMASTGYQNAGYQTPAQTVNQGGVTYQAVPVGQTPQSSRPQMGPMGGYGQH